jgi:hypothetical protein
MGHAVGVLSLLPTKDGGVLRTIGDARAYMLGLSEVRQWLDHWKPAYRLFVHGAGAAPLTLQAYAGLSKDGQLDVEAFEHIAPCRPTRPRGLPAWAVTGNGQNVCPQLPREQHPKLSNWVDVTDVTGCA